MITVFSRFQSPRLKHVLDFVFASKGQPYRLSSHQTETIAFNYSSLHLEAPLSVLPSGLLEATKVDPHLRLKKEGERLQVNGVDDPLSVIFYILTRYEEYQAYTPDQHGRFSARQSQQFKLGVLHLPIVDQLVKQIWREMGLDYTSVLKQFDCIPSFDIDVAWAYKNRPLWRTLAALVKGKFTERLSVLFGSQRDPYDTYSDITRIAQKTGQTRCFFLLSNWGVHDKNISWNNRNYRSLIRQLHASAEVGIHPGYNSFLRGTIQRREIQRLAAILETQVDASRFHFLRFRLPKSYTLLLENGIRRDYSMGYTDHIGFRAGTSFPHLFFDLVQNKATPLQIFPFAYMDGALRDHLLYTPEVALSTIREMTRQIRDVGGTLMCVWHNTSITDRGAWKGWKAVLNQTMAYAQSLKV